MTDLQTKWELESWYVMKAPNRGGVSQREQRRFGMTDVPLLFRVTEKSSNGDVLSIAYDVNGTDVVFGSKNAGWGNRVNPLFLKLDVRFFRKASVTLNIGFVKDRRYTTRDGCLIDILSRMHVRGSTGLKHAIRGNGNRLTLRATATSSIGSMHGSTAELRCSEGHIRNMRKIHMNLPHWMAKMFDEYTEEFADPETTEPVDHDKLEEDMNELFGDKKSGNKGATIAQVIDTMKKESESELAFRALNALRILISCKDERDALRYHSDGYVKGIDSVEKLIEYATLRKETVIRETNASAEHFMSQFTMLKEKKESLENIEL